MAQATMYVTREEFDHMRTELANLSIRVEVLAEGLTSLTKDVADLAEQMNGRFDAVDARLDGMDARLDGMDGRLEGMDNRLRELARLVVDGHAVLHQAIAEGNASLMAAISKLVPH